MKRETVMWKKIREILLRAKLDPVRVENPVHPGTPDVNLSSGLWLELKCLLAWPTRPHLQVTIKHFTPQQRVWLYRRWHYAPGSTLLLLHVEEDKSWLLFDGDVAAKIVGRKNEADLRRSACAIFVTADLEKLPEIIEHTRQVRRVPAS